KRKNKQLVSLSDMLSRSESRYRELTNALPLLIVTMDAAGQTTFANRWLFSYTGQDLPRINETRCASVINPADLAATYRQLDTRNGHSVELQCRLREGATGEYRWHSGIATPVGDGGWHLYLADIHAQK